MIHWVFGILLTALTGLGFWQYLRFVASRKASDVLLTKLSDLITSESRRATELSGAIYGILQERDGWRRLYFEQAQGHDNAQAMMMDEITRLHLALQRAGHTLQLNPVISAVRGEWVQGHGQEARQAKAASSPTPADGMPSKSPE